MASLEEQQNNPLHGLGLEALLTELVHHYDWEILAAYTNLNCFKNNPSIAASVKFLKKTEWAREKLEDFYLYRFKRMPKPDNKEYDLPPRKRVFRSGLEPLEPSELSLEHAEEIRARKAKVTRERFSGKVDPWGKR
ncbi:VF530 family DNA-binding protein [Thalassomonas sp. M1454]|uniref:VF530 family protein n=1 Tax=Thalassomonas sp. M1454 TaxID=2594477 RepID=UPI0011807BF1|nr:VF530 family DNA-binding protein [Thalassomonas sp. M1454]TRX53925.1 DNA-binding protein VF530 [Thalassomonas sp. M1454]